MSGVHAWRRLRNPLNTPVTTDPHNLKIVLEETDFPMGFGVLLRPKRWVIPM